MYTIESLKRKIEKEGPYATKKFLLSENLPLQLKRDLEKIHVFNNGYLCISFFYTLCNS